MPYFAVNFSSKFGEYNARIDKGLPGGIFWYLPTLSIKKNKEGEASKKIDFPINTIMNWWIDLTGYSKNKFYSINKLSSLSPNTLKKWNTELVTPDITSIKDLFKFDYEYNACFEYDAKNDIEFNFKSALAFIKSKSLSLEDLKNEIPNTDTIIDKLYYSSLMDDEDKKRFVTYIATRWAKPTPEQLEQLLTIAMFSQHMYKDICSYFGMDAKTIIDNKVWELISQHNDIYNSLIELQMGKTPSQNIDDIILINEFKMDAKGAADQIIAKISSDLAPNKYTPETEKQVFEAIEFLENTTSDAEEKEYILSIDNCDVLNNIGEYFQGHNYLTDKSITPNTKRAFLIFKQYVDISKTELHIKVSLSHLLNLLTFPLYPKYMTKGHVGEYLELLESKIDNNSYRERLSMLQFHGYYQMNIGNNTKALAIIKQFMNESSSLKPQEYVSELLFFAESLEFIQDNKKLFRKLQSRNKKHPRYNQLIQLFRKSKRYSY